MRFLPSFFFLCLLLLSFFCVGLPETMIQPVEAVTYQYYTINTYTSLGGASSVRADAATFDEAYELEVGEQMYEATAGLSYQNGRSNIWRMLAWFDTSPYSGMTVVAAHIQVEGEMSYGTDYPDSSFYITANTADLTPPLSYSNFYPYTPYQDEVFMLDEELHSIEVGVGDLNLGGYSSFGVRHVADVQGYDPGWTSDTYAWGWITSFKLVLTVSIPDENENDYNVTLTGGVGPYVNGQSINVRAEVPVNLYSLENYLWVRDDDGVLVGLFTGMDPYHYHIASPGVHTYQFLLNVQLGVYSDGDWTVYVGNKVLTVYNTMDAFTFQYQDYNNEYIIEFMNDVTYDTMPITFNVRCPSGTVFDAELVSLSNATVVQTINFTMGASEYFASNFNPKPSGDYFCQLKVAGVYVGNSSIITVLDGDAVSYYAISMVKTSWRYTDTVTWTTRRSSGTVPYVVEVYYLDHIGGNGLVYTKSISRGDAVTHTLKADGSTKGSGDYEIHLFPQGGDMGDWNSEKLSFTIGDADDEYEGGGDDDEPLGGYTPYIGIGVFIGLLGLGAIMSVKMQSALPLPTVLFGGLMVFALPGTFLCVLPLWVAFLAGVALLLIVFMMIRR